VLLHAVNGTLNACLHLVIVCYHRLEHDIVFSVIVDDFFRLEFLSTVCWKVANLSISESDELFEKRKRRRTSFGKKGHKHFGTIINEQ